MNRRFRNKFEVLRRTEFVKACNHAPVQQAIAKDISYKYNIDDANVRNWELQELTASDELAHAKELGQLSALPLRRPFWIASATFDGGKISFFLLSIAKRSDTDTS
jgi:hypothetical protein